VAPRRVAAGTSVSEAVKTGDVLMAVDGEMLLRPSELEAVVKARGKAKDGRPLRLTLLRNHQECEVEVLPSDLETWGTSRIILYAGE
jgi:S1-C subfamily serine protease